MRLGYCRETLVDPELYENSLCSRKSCSWGLSNCCRCFFWCGGLYLEAQMSLILSLSPTSAQSGTMKIVLQEPWIATVKRPGPPLPLPSSNLIVSHNVRRFPPPNNHPQYEFPHQLLGSNVNLLHPVFAISNSHMSLSFPLPLHISSGSQLDQRSLVTTHGSAFSVAWRSVRITISSDWGFLQPLSIKHDMSADAIAFNTVDYVLDNPSSCPHNATRADLLIWILYGGSVYIPKNQAEKPTESMFTMVFDAFRSVWRAYGITARVHSPTPSL